MTDGPKMLFWASRSSEVVASPGRKRPRFVLLEEAPGPQLEKAERRRRADAIRSQTGSSRI